MMDPLDRPREALTRRERDVLALLAERLSDREIAEQLKLSLQTVKWYTRHIYSKLGVAGRREAAAYARQFFGEAPLARLDGAGQPANGDAPVLEERSRHNLPGGWPRLIGRERELAQVTNHLVSDSCRLLTLVGPGGSGKTHLALEACARQVGCFGHGVYFISLAPLQSASAIPSAIAQALEFSFYPGDPVQELLAYLRHREVLLLFDNFEHLRDGASLLSAILQAAPRVKILVTSRDRLSLRNEFLFPVPGLAYPDAQPEMEQVYPAVELFLEQARRVHPHFQPLEGEWETIGRICQTMQGLPLALLLAAGWMEVLSPAEILQEIETRCLEFLETDLKDLPERQRSLRAVFDGSYNLLFPREREIFASLSVFRGGFTLASAQAVTGVTLRELRALMNKSMVQRAPAGLYTLHELLRQYGEDLLDRSPVLRETARDRHCAHFAAALARWWNDLRGPRQFIALQELGLALENALVAWHWMAEHVQVQRMRQSFFALQNFLLVFYGEVQGVEVGKRIISAAEEKLSPPVLSAPTAFTDGARLLATFWSFRPALTFQHTEDTVSFLVRCENLLDQLEAAGEDVRLEKADLFRILGALYSEAGEGEKMRRLWEQSLDWYRALGDPWREAILLSNWGWVAAQMGAQQQAQQMLQRSITLFQGLGDHIRLCSALLNLREVTWTMLDGSFEPYEPLLREHVASCQKAGHAKLIASSRGELGAFFLRQGRFVEGAAELAESCTAYNDLGDVAFFNFYGLYLSEAQMHLGLFQQANASCQEILPFHRKTSQHALAGFNLLLLGWTAIGLRQYAQAAQYLAEVDATETSLRMNERAMGFASQAYAERGLGSPERAASLLSQALTIGIELRFAPVFYYALPAAALILADRGQVERAVEVYALVSRFPYVANSRLFRDIAGQEIAARAAGLPPDVVSAAQARGKAGDPIQMGKALLREFEKDAGSEELPVGKDSGS